MYYVLSTKILQGSDTASGTDFQKRCSKICGLNPRLIYLQRVFKKLYAGNRTLFPLAVVLVSTIREVFLKNFFSKFENIGYEDN